MTLSTDNYWKIQGLDLENSGPTSTTPTLTISTSLQSEFLDCKIRQSTSQSTNTTPVRPGADYIYVKFTKTWIQGAITANSGKVIKVAVDTYGKMEFYDCLVEHTGTADIFYDIFDCNTTQLSFFNIVAVQTEFKSGVSGGTPSIFDLTVSNWVIKLRNCILTTISLVESGGVYDISSEDHSNTKSDTRRFTLDDVVVLQSDTGTVRSGGSNISLKVTPNTEFSTLSEFSKLLLFELPIYATTDSKTYDIYFRPTATTDWTNDPTASELWIELEAWGHATNNFRKITKSTGVIDMNGSTDWQALSVTVAPAQAGVAYLRAYYCKTKEAGANIFFVDPIPVIS